MKYPVFSIRDKASCFMPPIANQTEQYAIRSFAQAINEGNLHFEPGDFDLFKVGFFDDQSGEIEHILPEFVVNGQSLVRRSKDEV